MLLIGSQALAHHGLCLRNPADTDYICTFEQFQKWSRENKMGIKQCQPLSDTKFHVLTNYDWNIEFEIAWEGTAARQLLDIYNGEGVASVDWLYALKMSHRYLRNSSHFAKTMRDIKMLREHVSPDAQLIIDSEWFKQREEQTYTYKHPKLDVSKQEFFTDDVPYVYDHDSLHMAVALMCVDFGEYEYLMAYHPEPAYKHYMKDGSEVMTSKEKFMSAPEHVRLYGVYEESCVLALERSQIPFVLCGATQTFPPPTPRQSFMKALEKVCTSITSGWFREYAWESYDKVVALYEELGENDYVKRFLANQHLLKPFEGKMQ